MEIILLLLIILINVIYINKIYDVIHSNVDKEKLIENIIIYNEFLLNRIVDLEEEIDDNM